MTPQYLLDLPTLDQPSEEAVPQQRRTRAANEKRFRDDAVAIETESAQAAGAVGYMARVLVQATMPHSKQPGNEFVRSNGQLKVTIVATSDVGLPYGCYPRLLLAWLTTEAVRTRSPTLHIGRSLSEFMRTLGLLPSGGDLGSMPRLKDQARRLFRSYVTATPIFESDEPGRDRGRNMLVADDWDLWWNPGEAPQEQGSSFQSWVKLSDKFYRQVTDRPVPVDMRAIRALKKSPLALDLYAWATYRTSYLRESAHIPWEYLQMQFGADYAESAEGRRNFKKKIIAALEKVSKVYAQLRIDAEEDHLVLRPSRPHIPRLGGAE